MKMKTGFAIIRAILDSMEEEEEPEVIGWKSMDSAPRNGKLIRLLLEKEDTDIGRWDNTSNQWVIFNKHVVYPLGWKPVQ